MFSLLRLGLQQTKAGYFHPSAETLVHPPTHLSPTHHLAFQLQTIMEHFHLVCLAALFQWLCAAQHPPPDLPQSLY